MTITAIQLRDFCAGAIAFLRGGDAPGDWMWLLLQNGQTVVIPGTETEHYDDHTQWPMLLMTGPDPVWLLSWWIEPGLGGDEWVAARAVALEQARTASDDEWLAVCQRAIDEQLGAMVAEINQEGTP